MVDCVPMMWDHLLFILSFCMGLTHSLFYTPVTDSSSTNLNTGTKNTITLGRCQIAIDRSCPDRDITFFLYSRQSPHIGRQIYVGSEQYDSNLLDVNFNPLLPTKVLIHGYNSDMLLGALEVIKMEYFLRHNVNIIMVDWSSLAAGPCYPAAVWNTRVVGKCTAQLLERIWEIGTTDVHLVGFSLGAHVAGFTGNNVRPYKIPRITGLDPAMPGFTTVSIENKLDPSDADFVDVIHTNAFVQGTVQQSGHVDFYVNGGVTQPGCWAESRFIACNHHRAPLYFSESINTRAGFWGWPCPSYVDYLLGRCLPTEPQIIMGEHVNEAARGIHLVITNSVTPFAVGKYTGPLIDIYKSRTSLYVNSHTSSDVVNEFLTENVIT